MRWRTLLAAACLGAIAAAAAPEPAKADGPVVLYAGIGHLPNSADPTVVDLFRAGSARNANLLRSIARAGEAAAMENRIAWSDFPILVRPEDAQQAMTALTGRDWRGRTVQAPDLADAAGELLSLIVVLDTNLHAERARAGARPDHHFMAWATAMLVKPGDGDVVMAASGSDETMIRNRAVAEADHLGHYAEAYRNAAVNAIRQLARLSHRHSRTTSWDPMMVTRVVLGDQAVLDRYQAGHAENWNARVCDTGSQCRGPWCEKLMGIAAQITTRSLTTAGALMLAPYHFNRGGETVSDQLSVRFGLARGPASYEDAIRITVAPNRAGSMIVAVIPRLRSVIDLKKGSLVGHRHHIASIRIYKYLNVGGSGHCNAEFEARLPVVSNHFKELAVIEKVIKGQPRIADGLHRALDVIALQNAGSALACKITGKEPPCH